MGLFLWSWSSNPRCQKDVVMVAALLSFPFMVGAIASSSSTNTVIKLQTPHPLVSPSDSIRQLALDCDELGVKEWDVYGDFHLAAEGQESFLRSFEREIAQELGKEDAVFMPSGGMAQSIALLIHSARNEKTGKGGDRRSSNTSHRKYSFICHATSHLLLHEQNAFRELCDMEAIALPEKGGLGLGAQPLSYQHVKDRLDALSKNEGTNRISDAISSILLELPHRELGGKVTPWEDVLKLSELAKEEGIALHCDGARIFEATTGYEKTPAELAKPFDSIYISFYKGLGGLSGAMLLGSKDFCAEARVWLRRFGGNLYTLLPYAVSGWSGYKRYWDRPRSSTLMSALGKESSKNDIMSFQEKKEKLERIVQAISERSEKFGMASKPTLVFEPRSPTVNMVHCYLRPDMDVCERIRDKIEQLTGVSIFHRLRTISSDDPGFEQGFRCKFELSIGEANGSIPDEIWIQNWEMFLTEVV